MTARMTQWACMFPGQGSQSLGMLGDIAAMKPQFKTAFESASQVLGYDLWQLVSQGPEAQLNQTEYTQPALLVASWAIYQVGLKAQNLTPHWVLGHSLGEYTALVAAGSLDFEDAVDVVRHRGRYMQEASDAGAMAAIVGPTDIEVADWCAEFSKPGEVLSPANLNAPGQVVVSGHREAVERLVEHALKQKVKMAKRLAVSVAAHSDLMKPAALKLAEKLGSVRVRTPQIPLINNVDVQRVSHPDDIRDMLFRQMFSPVRWTESIETLREEGVSDFVECGPGRVLCGLGKRIDRAGQYFPTEKPDDLETIITYLQS